jgi:CBS domain-containing protein
MTPAIFSVPLHLPADRVVEQMLTLDVHQLYVVDESQSLVGVISAHDVLRRLRAE